jgi:hypothetical protein
MESYIIKINKYNNNILKYNIIYDLYDEYNKKYDKNDNNIKNNKIKIHI